MAIRPKIKAVPPDDSVLVARIRGGDHSAFTTLYQRHVRYVASVVFRLMGSDGELDDILQETFADASQRLAMLREPARARHWFVTIAVRHACRALAARRRRTWFGLRVGELAPLCSDPRISEAVEDLYDALDRIAPRLRIPWILHRIEEHELADVAQMCGVSRATVKRRIAKADEYLERRLHE